jgi:hypothetical protein
MARKIQNGGQKSRWRHMFIYSTKKIDCNATYQKTFELFLCVLAKEHCQPIFRIQDGGANRQNGDWYKIFMIFFVSFEFPIFY